MANYLYRRMNRELRKIKYRAVGSAVLIIISVMIYVGFKAMLPIATNALEGKIDELNLNDYLVHVNSANESATADLGAIPGVDTVESRLQVATRMTYTDGGKDTHVAASVFGIDPATRPRINMLELTGDKSRYFSGNGSGTLLVERNFANQAGVKVGETVTLNTNHGPVSLEVIAIVMTPEYFFMPVNPQSLLPYPGNLAVAYVPIDWLRGAFDLPTDMVNEFTFIFEKGYGGERMQETINARLADDVLLFTIPKDEVYGYKLIREDLSEGEEFIGLFAALLLFIAFFIVYTSFSRIVEEQKREIGVLRALGYSRTKVLGSYVYMSLLIGALSSLVGVLLGLPMGQILGAFYVEMMIGTSISSFAVAIEAYVVGMLFGPLTAMLACVIAVWGTVTMDPQDAIRGVPRSFLKARKWSRKGPKKVGRAPRGAYISHYTVKNMARHKTRTILTTLAIGGGIMLGAMSLVMMASFNNSLDKSIDDYEKWDVLVEFSFPLNETAASTVTAPQITSSTYISRISGEWQMGGSNGLAILLGLDHDQVLHKFTINKGTRARAVDEVMVNEVFADENGIEKGDAVTIQTLAGPKSFRVTALVNDYIGTIYVDMSVIEQVAGMKVYSGMYIKTAAGQAAAAKEVLVDNPLVSEAQTRSAAKGALFEFMESFASLLYVMVLLGVAVAAPTLANIVLVGVLERYPEYGQLRAIGYSKGAVARSILHELMIITTAGAIIGAPLTYLFVWGYEASFRAFYPTYQTILYPADWFGYLFTVFVIYIIAFLAAAPSIRKVNRMDVAKVVSGERFG